ncbi:MAG: hypothetical protein KatS3mg105_4981 [Gemmatales bacterium]|nr:MAG: hypothetical protein KatS3mg105_4981 [Gemmatales bacterium]
MRGQFIWITSSHLTPGAGAHERRTAAHHGRRRPQLDRYLIGDATKLNPEQPGVVIRVEKEEDRLGGAAAVAMIAAGFGARVTLAGVVGRDEPGRRLQQLISDHGIEPHLWTDDRPTTWKQRIIARGQLRPDRCDREVTTAISDHAARFCQQFLSVTCSSFPTTAKGSVPRACSK